MCACAVASPASAHVHASLIQNISNCSAEPRTPRRPAVARRRVASLQADEGRSVSVRTRKRRSTPAATGRRACRMTQMTMMVKLSIKPATAQSVDPSSRTVGSSSGQGSPAVTWNSVTNAVSNTCPRAGTGPRPGGRPGATMPKVRSVRVSEQALGLCAHRALGEKGHSDHRLALHEGRLGMPRGWGELTEMP